MSFPSGVYAKAIWSLYAKEGKVRINLPYFSRTRITPSEWVYCPRRTRTLMNSEFWIMIYELKPPNAKLFLSHEGHGWARMFFSHAVLKPQITLINDVESLLHSANLSELNSALACTRFVTDYCKLLRSCVLRSVENSEFWIMISEPTTQFILFLCATQRPIRIESWKLKIESLFHFLSLSSNMQLKRFGVTFYEGFGVVYH